MKSVLILAATMLLAACGATRGLKPQAGEQLPPAPYGATATPMPNDLLTPETQARPGRSDELLRGSQERRSDDFDLPPR